MSTSLREFDSSQAANDPSAVKPLLLDACCAINLYATCRVAEIIADLPFEFYIADIARQESLYVRRGGQGEDARQLELVDWRALLDTGCIGVLHLSSEFEEVLFVEMAAARLDDGEAATCALAISRGYAVATDDRRPHRLLTERAPQLKLFSTLQLVHQWCALRCLRASEAATLLKDLRERGNFLPPRGDPLRAWWESLFRQ